MIAFIAIVTLAIATPVPAERDLMCVPMPVMLSFQSKTVPRTLDGSRVDRDYIEPFFAVLSFKKAYKSATGVDNDPRRVDVHFAKYGRFILVILADNYAHRDNRGSLVLGCEGVEYYRVDPASGEVLPFDGCVEPHKRVLPALSQLPQ